MDIDSWFNLAMRRYRGVNVAKGKPEFSEMQKKVLRIIARRDGEQLSGNGCAGAISSAKALVRRGLLCTPGSSCYYLTDAGKPIAKALLEQYRAEKVAGAK